jgi:endonuclease G
MEIHPRLLEEVLDRLRASEEEREQTRRCIKDGQIWQADSPERIEKRKVQVLNNKSLASFLGRKNQDILAGTSLSNAPYEAQQAFEKVIGELDIQHCWFLTRGSQMRRTVGRVHLYQNGRRAGSASGFLVAQNLFVTNQHVLDSLSTAKESRVEFDYEETYTGELLPSASFDFAPDTLFLSSPAQGGLDYALVAVNTQARPDSFRADANLTEFGFNLLIRQEGKIAIGETINIIHHPEGQPRQVSLRENRLLAMQTLKLEDVWMHYETDTQPGSSGSPLFNSQWQVVGIHHMAVEKRDKDGNILAIGGDIWTQEMGERQKWWYANEGLRISRFLADVEKKIKEATIPLVTGEQVITEIGVRLVEGMMKLQLDSVKPNIPANSSSKSKRFKPD